ncbi:MAG TPA: AMP-binding protein [Gammaproteobacteria bacterium]|nr:AMP-binding protein [Gammaproteobacteria bacterium]
MEKVWLKNYPQGVPAEINPDAYQSIAEMFEQACAEFKTLPAFYNLGVTLSFQEIDHLSQAFAAYLQSILNLKKGDRLAIMLPNVLQYPVVMFGALRAGLIVVNVNPLYTPIELIHQMNDSGAETLVVLANFLNTVKEALPHTPLKNIIVTNIGDLFPEPKAFLINFYLKYIQKKIPCVHIPESISFKNVIREGKKLALDPVKISPDDIAFLQYTGGTTGVAKGAMLTHRNIIANVVQAEAWLSPILERGKEVVITALPLYHIFSLTGNCLILFKAGGLNVLITNPRDLPHMISELSKFQFTVITGVNTLFNSLLKNPKFAKLDFSKLKLSFGGGMAVQKAVAEKWQALTGVTLLEAYGLTETSPCVTINPPDLKNYNGTVGLPVCSTDVAILDENGNEVPFNEPGELAVKGPQVMKGYWQNPEETQKVLIKNGWLLTGDIASIDEQGYVRIRERKKDMILVSGFNVYPNEIEDVIAELSGVKEVAVIGVPDENSGEAVKAFIVKENPSLTADDVLLHCHKYLTGYKIPKHIEFVAGLPKSNVGKILRRALRTC